MRVLQYIPELQKHGYDIEVLPLFDDQYLNDKYQNLQVSILKIAKCYLLRIYNLRKIQKRKVIMIEKELFPYLPAIVERFLSLFGFNYIVDYDDAIFHNYDDSKNIFFRVFFKNKIDVVMQNASLVICGNSYLRVRAIKAGAKNTVLIPTVVDISRYPKKDVFFDSNNITIGWIGSPSTQKYIENLSAPITKFFKKNNGALLVIGAHESIKSFFPDIKIIVKPWSEELEVQYIMKMDIGIMPLIDSNWEQGKCGYKLIQYMACGIPVIASPVGVNKKIVTDSCSGILANRLGEWDMSFEDIISSRERFKNFSDSGRQAVTNYYELKVQTKALVKAFQSSI
jgi:glycosyltransferase involved in cell wall biosynthesis